jgi:phage-related protein
LFGAIVAEIPVEHVRDSHKLLADGRVDLFELTPSGGTGVIRFKNDNNVTWRGQLYTGLPLTLTGEKRSDNGNTMPRLQIGQPNIDISQFKALVYDGYLDNAIVTKITVLLDNLINNRFIRETTTYRVKRVEGYSRSQISLQLATLSDSLGFSMPYRTYTPPGFPSVQM